MLAPRQSRDSKVRVTCVFQLIQGLYEGSWEDTDRQVIKRRVTSSDYKHLLVRIARDPGLQAFFDPELHFDYSHDKSELIIRITSILHEHIVDEISILIGIQLQNFKALLGTRATERTAEVAKNIYSAGSITLEFPSRMKNNLKRPDRCFVHEGCDNYVPTLVVEVAWSQRPLDLAKLAKEYIQSGEVRTVVGIDVSHQRTREVAPGTSARFLIWRAGLLNQRGKYSAGEPFEQEFRNENREAIPGADLRLLLTDFLCRDCADSFADVREEIVLSSTALCKYLATGERLSARNLKHREVSKAASV